MLGLQLYMVCGVARNYVRTNGTLLYKRGGSMFFLFFHTKHTHVHFEDMQHNEKQGVT